MAKFQFYHNRFLTGEISPRAVGRVDIQQYDSAVARMENFTVHTAGGAFKRPGTLFAADISMMPNAAIIPFLIDDDEGFVVTLDLSASTNNFKVFNEQGVEQAIQSNIAMELPLITSFPKPGLDPTGFIYSQQGDLLVIVHASGEVPPLLISRLGGVFSAGTYHISSSGFILGDSEFPNTAFRVPYRPVNTSSISITVSEITSSPIDPPDDFLLSASQNLFNAGHVGALFKVTVGTNTSVYRIQSVISPTQAVSIRVVAGSGGLNSATTNWEEQAWSDFRGWPRTVVGFQQRLVFGGNEAQPVTIWASLLGNIFFMNQRKLAQDQDVVQSRSDGIPEGTPGFMDSSGLGFFGINLESDPFDFNLATTVGSGITFLANDRSLVVGTSTEEYVAGRAGQFFGFSDTSSVDVSLQTNYGSRRGKVISVRDETLFFSRDARKLRNFRFSENNGSNISANLSLMADRIHRHGGNSTGFKEVTYNQTRDIIWALTNNSALVGFTYQQDAGAIAWHRHSIAGADEITGIANIPSISGNFDTTYLVVKRTVDGANVTYLERMLENFDGELDTAPPVDTEEDIPVFLDSALLFTLSSASNTITGLSHLEGKTVTAVSGNLVIGDFTVNGGSITLANSLPANTFLVVGLRYNAEIDMLPIEAGGDFGSAQTQIRRIDQVTGRFYKTFNLKVGQFGKQLLTNFKFSELTTGLIEVYKPTGHNNDLALRLVSDQPFPCNILAIQQRGVTTD